MKHLLQTCNIIVVNNIKALRREEDIFMYLVFIKKLHQVVSKTVMNNDAVQFFQKLRTIISVIKKQ